ncbi:hypothetical protein LPJ66_001835 [Kickxella alabastrina]|uniref:Uncharacterized protein n=1 Tax=Kickxella alabastrina TaxID=61397 RepID=A0ACC1IS39_9FUNG|nr:hypothetical protein LPJ66_001835 [Kickxella alabastrina]
MSFKLTPEEISRVEMAAFLGVHLDPIGYVDLSTIMVLSTMYLVEFLALCYQIQHRNYPPLKVKNIYVMTLLYLGGVTWLVGDIFTGGLVHLGQSPVLRTCKLTVIWFRVCFGAYYVTSIFALRCYSLYHIFHKGIAFKGKVSIISIGLTVSSIIIFGIISTLVPTRLTTSYEELLDICYTTMPYIVSVLLVIWSIWTYTAVMSWRMRNISFCFNERRELLVSFLIMFAVSILNTICLLIVPIYMMSLGWRTSLLYVNHLSASTVYWVVMWEPTYNCIFHHDEYLEYWISILKEDAMERQYEYPATDNEETFNLVELSGNLYKDGYSDHMLSKVSV